MIQSICTTILTGTVCSRDLYDRYRSHGFLPAGHARNERYEVHRLEGRSFPETALELLRRLPQELRFPAKAPIDFLHVNNRPIGDVFVPLRHADQRPKRTASGRPFAVA
jgi:hypothetical protein